jgi:hypothetical protein
MPLYLEIGIHFGSIATLGSKLIICTAATLGISADWLGARSEVIYTIMSDEQQRQRLKGPRPFGLQRKSSPGSSKGSTVLPIRSSPFSCPASDFGCNAARGNNGV